MVKLFFKKAQKSEVDKQQKMLLSLRLRSNPQTEKPYIHKYDGLCTSIGHHISSAYYSTYGSPFVTEIDDNLTIVGLFFVLFQGQIDIYR